MKRRRMPILRNFSFAALALIAFSNAAFAHADHGQAGGFISGFRHPILGWHHVAAMVAIGLWGAFLGRPAIWLLPVVFPLVMALAAALKVIGLRLPGVETGITGSAVVLGLLIAFPVRPPLWAAALVVVGFAVFHEHAHGTELSTAVNPFAYAVGFVLSTGLLYAAGILVGLLVSLHAGKLAIRGGGGLISLAGIVFLTGAF